MTTGNKSRSGCCLCTNSSQKNFIADTSQNKACKALEAYMWQLCLLSAKTASACPPTLFTSCCGRQSSLYKEWACTKSAALSSAAACDRCYQNWLRTEQRVLQPSALRAEPTSCAAAGHKVTHVPQLTCVYLVHDSAAHIAAGLTRSRAESDAKRASPCCSRSVAEAGVSPGLKHDRHR